MPQDLLYNKTHEWVRLEDGGKTAVVGLTAFALEMLTDLVHVELPPVGKQVEAGQPFGEIESVKAVSDLNSPVSGEVAEINESLVDNLETWPTIPIKPAGSSRSRCPANPPVCSTRRPIRNSAKRNNTRKTSG